jgi:hypothetical protein
LIVLDATDFGPQLLSAAAEQDLFARIDQSLAQVLDFLQTLAADRDPATLGVSSTSSASPTAAATTSSLAVQDVALGAARVLGRFLSESPGSFSDRLPALLPFLLSLGRGTPASAVRFLLPYLTQVLHETPDPLLKQNRELRVTEALCDCAVAAAAAGAQGGDPVLLANGSGVTSLCLQWHFKRLKAGSEGLVQTEAVAAALREVAAWWERARREHEAAAAGSDPETFGVLIPAGRFAALALSVLHAASCPLEDAARVPAHGLVARALREGAETMQQVAAAAAAGGAGEDSLAAFAFEVSESLDETSECALYLADHDPTFAAACTREGPLTALLREQAGAGAAPTVGLLFQLLARALKL